MWLGFILLFARHTKGHHYRPTHPTHALTLTEFQNIASTILTCLLIILAVIQLSIYIYQGFRLIKKSNVQIGHSLRFFITSIGHAINNKALAVRTSLTTK